MHTVRLPDPLYMEAHRAASANGVSIESFVADAVQLHLHDEPDGNQRVVLTAEQVNIIERGRSDIRAGKGLTMDQVERDLAAKKAEWLEANPR